MLPHIEIRGLPEAEARQLADKLREALVKEADFREAVIEICNTEAFYVGDQREAPFIRVHAIDLRKGKRVITAMNQAGILVNIQVKLESLDYFVPKRNMKIAG